MNSSCVRLQVDDGDDECYDDDYPYDTDDSNGNRAVQFFCLFSSSVRYLVI